jgi:hypothetical protein
LLGYNTKALISINAILAATKNKDKGRLVMLMLLERFYKVIPLLEETTIACASNLAHTNDLIKMLLEHNITN